jgi:hypothetical protein
MALGLHFEAPEDEFLMTGMKPIHDKSVRQVSDGDKSVRQLSDGEELVIDEGKATLRSLEKDPRQAFLDRRALAIEGDHGAGGSRSWPPSH